MGGDAAHLAEHLIGLVELFDHAAEILVEPRFQCGLQLLVDGGADLLQLRGILGAKLVEPAFDGLAELLAACALGADQFVDGKLCRVETLFLMVADLAKCFRDALAHALETAAEFFTQISRRIRMRGTGLIELAFDHGAQRFAMGRRALLHAADIRIQLGADLVDAPFGGLVRGFETQAEAVHLPKQLFGEFQHHGGGSALLLVDGLHKLLPHGADLRIRRSTNGIALEAQKLAHLGTLQRQRTTHNHDDGHDREQRGDESQRQRGDREIGSEFGHGISRVLFLF